MLLPFSISEIKYKIQKCKIEGQICLLMWTRFSTDVKKNIVYYSYSGITFFHTSRVSGKFYLF